MKIGILGAKGRMGRMIAEEISASNGTIAAAVDAGDDTESAFKTCDVLIDFTCPTASVRHAALAAQFQKPLVIGTTGFSDVETAEIKAAATKAPILLSANMSLGVNLLLKMVEDAARRLGTDFDIEIFEAHHKMKADAPSGTALALGRAAAIGRGVTLEKVMATDRNGKRKAGDIGFSVFRGGDVVGEHTVTFAAAGERIEFSHKATDREIFARGAIKAAQFLQKQKPGFYTMKDVLGL